MNQSSQDHVAIYLRRSAAALEKAAGDKEFMATTRRIADAISSALLAGGKVMLAGNGGSAADAQHLAAEFLSRFISDRNPLPAIALTTDSSVLTAIGNDYGFEHVFERQVRGLGGPKDVFIAISTSGRSPNILAALKAARAMGITTIGFSKVGGVAMLPFCDLCLEVPVDETAIVQQIHMVAGHAICGIVESAFSKGSPEGN